MTKEEAIKNREECLKYLEGIGAMASSGCVEAVKWSIKALRAYHHKLDRSRWKGCFLCKDATYLGGDVCVSGTHCVGLSEFDFCPNCSRPLTEESWAELERKIFES